jgi:hypothetical protein
MAMARAQTALPEASTLNIAVAALRHLTLVHEHVIIVEDAQTARLLRDLTGSSTKFVSSLSQLDCRHLPNDQLRHCADVVIAISEAATETAPGTVVASRFRARLRALVDRDICPSYAPLSVLAGQAPPCRHQAALNRCPLLRTTPLNDVESTVFALRIGGIARMTASASLICEELGLTPDATDDAIGRRVMTEWLIPLFCIRSFFARTTPPQTTKGICALIGTGAFAMTLARSPSERGVKLAKALPFSRSVLSADQTKALAREIDAVVAADSQWPNFVHGHDLIQVMAVWRARASGSGFLTSDKFSCSSPSQISTTAGFEVMKSWEQDLANCACELLEPVRSKLVPDLYTTELLRRILE